MHRLKIIEWAKVKYVLRGILVGIVAGIVVSAFRMAIYELLGILPNIYNYNKEKLYLAIHLDSYYVLSV